MCFVLVTTYNNVFVSPAVMTDIRTTMNGHVLYLAGDASNFAYFDTNPFGLESILVDAMRTSNEPFFSLLHQLDGLVYDDKTLAMEKWVLLDCGLLPSCFVGLAKSVENCSKEVLQRFDIPQGYKGLVPLTEYCTTPTIVPGTWIGHTCGTLEKGKKLGLLSKVLGLKIFKVQQYIGVTQYDNIAVQTHTIISDLLLKSAITPTHSIPNMTFVYKHDVNQATLEEKFQREDKKEKTEKLFRDQAIHLLDPYDTTEKQKLQREIECGRNFSIVFPGQITKNGKLVLPIKHHD